MEGSPMKIVSMPPVFERGQPDKATLDDFAAAALEQAEQELEKELRGINMDNMRVKDLKSKIMRSPLIKATKHIDDRYRHKVFYRALELYEQSFSPSQGRGRHPGEDAESRQVTMENNPGTKIAEPPKTQQRASAVIRSTSSSTLSPKWRISPDQAARNIATLLGEKPEQDQQQA